MKAVQYNFTIPNYLATRAADKLPLGLYEKGKVPGLSMIDAPSRPLPGPEWLRVRPRMAGICGSDTSLLHGTSSPVLSPFVSFPTVMGHETIADVLEVGDDVTHVGGFSDQVFEVLREVADGDRSQDRFASRIREVAI